MLPRPRIFLIVEAMTVALRTAAISITVTTDAETAPEPITVVDRGLLAQNTAANLPILKRRKISDRLRLFRFVGEGIPRSIVHFAH